MVMGSTRQVLPCSLSFRTGLAEGSPSLSSQVCYMSRVLWVHCPFLQTRMLHWWKGKKNGLCMYNRKCNPGHEWEVSGGHRSTAEAAALPQAPVQDRQLILLGIVADYLQPSKNSPSMASSRHKIDRVQFSVAITGG